jgi:REP element-mobilizing transposase RayT
MKQLCKYKGVEILEGHLMPDNIHMLVSIPPKISVAWFTKGEILYHMTAFARRYIFHTMLMLSLVA